MRKYDLYLDKYCVTKSGCFILVTIVKLGVGATYSKILFYNGISEQNRDNKITTRD